MSWLLDTNVISEVRRGAACHPAVAAWWRGVAAADLHLSTLTLGEIRKGIDKLRRREAARAAALDVWLSELEEGFAGRLLPVDAGVAREWGRLAAIRSLPVIDALLGATASVHGLTLVTRNTANLDGLGLRLFNPFG